MCKRISLVLLVAFALCTPGSFVAALSGQDAGPTRDPKMLAERTQLRPVGKKETEKLWFAPGKYWVDGWEGGVQSGTLDETVELQIWNTTRKETFAPGFIRFERTAGGVKEGVLTKESVQCVVNPGRGSSLSLSFAGSPATVEFGYDGCVMKGTLVRDETLRKWDGTSEKYPAGSLVEFNGAGEVIRSVMGGTGGAAFDGTYAGQLTLKCPPGAYWLDVGKEEKTIPFNFVAKAGRLEGTGTDKEYELKWQGNYDGTGKIAKGALTGWIDFNYGRAYPDSKLRWTVTGPVGGTLAPPARGTLTSNTSTDSDRLPEPIVCEGQWSVTRGATDFTPTTDGTVIDIKKGEAGKLDLIFVIDQTSSMSSVFAEVQKTAKRILSTIAGAFPDYRVAIVAYRDWGDTEMFKDFGFSSDQAAIQAAIDSLSASGGGDTPEGVLEALLRALRLPWRNGVNKQIILMGDAPPHSPIPQGPDAGKTAKDVAKLAFEVDPAVIHAIATSVGGSVSKETSAAFEELATLTKGTMVTADKAEEVPKKIMDVVGTIKSDAVPSGGGGGGGPVVPDTGLNVPLVLAVVLLGACAVLGVAILVLRQRSAQPPAMRAAGAGGLRVHAGLRITRADGRTSQFTITGERTTIGRAEGNTLVVADAGASAYHAEIRVSREGFVLTDAGSANGTTVNGQPVTAASIFAGDEIGIGSTRLILTE